MKIVTIILGILMAICGISCICTPVMTFLEAGYFLVILLLVYGIAAIVKAVAQKEYGMPFLFGILSTVLGIVIMVVPGLKLMTDGMLIYIIFPTEKAKRQRLDWNTYSWRSWCAVRPLFAGASVTFGIHFWRSRRYVLYRVRY